jgi:predicted enzyme related to lactoylglutathione lyase
MKFGYTIIWVDDVEKTVEFYEKAFGLARRTLEDRGNSQWAEMETGQTILAFSSTTEAQTLFPHGFHPHNPKEPPTLTQLSFITPDVASAYMRALSAGAQSIDGPKAQPWGKMVARVRDLNGVLISLVSA